MLCADGKVNTAGEVTDLVAHSYVEAAKIYLHCKLFRYDSLSRTYFIS